MVLWKNFGELHEQMEWAYLMVGDNYRKAGEERVEEILQGM